jgi:outer membrane protein assembly factor BamA
MALRFPRPACAGAAVWLALATCVFAGSVLAEPAPPRQEPSSQTPPSQLPTSMPPVDARPLPAGATPTQSHHLPFTVPMSTDASPTSVIPGQIVVTNLGTPGVMAAEQACVERRIGAVTFEGCPGTRCEPEFVQARMASLTDLHPGQPLRVGRLAVALRRLQQLGFFRTLDVSCLPDVGGSAHLTFHVTGNLFVRKVEFTGNKAIFADELRSKALIRNGDVLNPDTPDGKNLLQRERESIEALYQRAGYDDARTSTTTRVIRQGELEVRIEIDERLRQRVTQKGVVIDELPAPLPDEKAAGLVCPFISERGVMEASELSDAEAFTRRLGEKARVRVRNYLRKLGFPNPLVTVGHGLDGSVTIHVAPGRCNLLRILVRDDVGTGQDVSTGYSVSDDRTLYEALPFGESGLFDFDEADRGRDDLLGVLANRGYLFADVRLDFRPVPKSLSTQVENAITYYVTTGYVSQVRGIAFPGRKGFSDGTLKGVLSTKAYDFFDTGGFAQIDQLLADLDSLKQFYRARGFYQFQFDLGLPENQTPTAANARGRMETRAATMYQYRYPGKGFQIRKPRGENFIYVDIPVTEGEQTRLGRLEIDGARQVSEAEVRSLLHLREGDVVSYEILSGSVTSVVQRYRNTGFFRMNLQTLCTARRPDRKEEQCTAENMLAGSVELRVVIQEGEQVDVGEVFVTGHFNTNEDVILRDMPRPGVPFSEEVLFDAQRKLRNLGIFTQVALQYIGRDESPPRRRVAIVVQVVEGQNRYLEGAGGFQTVNTQRSTATRDQQGNVSSAGEVESVPELVDTVGHLVSGMDRLTLGFGQSVGLSLPNLLFIGEATYVDRNFARSAKDFRIPVRVGFNFAPAYVQCRTAAGSRDAVGAVAQQGNCPGDSSWQSTLSRIRFFSLLPSYYDSRLLGSQYGLRLVLPYVVHDWAIQAIDIDKMGVIAEISRRFGKLSTSFGIDVGAIRSKRPEEPDFSATDGLKPQLQVIPRLTYDGTDSPLNPTRGFFVTAALPLIDTIIKVPNAPDCPNPNSCKPQTYSFPQVRFVKWEVTGKAYFSLGNSLTLATLLHAGYGTSIEANQPSALPQPERFRLGGQYGVRGFADYGLRQYDANGCTLATRNVADPVSHLTKQQTVAIGEGCSQPQSGDVLVSDGNVIANGTAELRFPLAREAGFWGSLFWDFGAIAETWTARPEETGSFVQAASTGIHTASFRQSIGAGLRWLLSGQIPLRVDYGIAIGKRCRDLPAGSDQCVTDDFGRLHLALLYSF